jgi:hypothetical protein
MNADKKTGFLCLDLRLSAAKYLSPLGTVGLFMFFLWYCPPAEPVFRLCPFYWLTGRPCPLCGLTRAFCALAKGHWSQAIHFHTLSPLAFAMLFSLFWKGRWRAPLWAGGLAAITLYGAWRAAFA